MKIVNQTWMYRLKSSLIIILFTSLGIFLFKLIQVDFDIRQIVINRRDFFETLFPSILAFLYVDKVRFFVKNIEDKNEFLDWLLNYFKNGSGEVVYYKDNHIIIQAPRRKVFFNKYSNKVYYIIQIEGNNARIKGPTYKVPRQLKQKASS